MPKQAFPPLSNNDSKILLLGTMPGEQSLKLQQYYGHKGNHFWKLLFTLFGETFTHDYDAKKALVLKNKIAVWDVLQNCEGEGSSDNAITNEVPNDFVAFYNAHPQIKNVFFVSKKAEAFYDKYVKKKDGLNYYVLPSPSSANTWKTFDEKLEEWKLVLNFL